LSQQISAKSRYQVIPRVLVFLTRGDEVLLIKRAADRPIFPGKYNGLGGHLERGESVLAAAQREVLEESGLTPIDLWLCATVAIDIGEADHGIAMWVFRGEAGDGDLIESTEGSLEWLPAAHIPQLDMVEDIPTLLPKVLAMQPGDPPLWGLYVYDDEGKLTMEFSDQ
jgi:8-oxo-dGTP diphosphatase